MLGISVTQDTYDRNPIWHPLTWDQIRELLTRHQFGHAKDAQPLFSPTRFEGGKKKEHVQDIGFGVLDLDDVPDEQLALACQAASRYAAFAFSTWTHPKARRKHLNRVRLCVPFSRPATPNEWYSVHAALTQEFSSSADPACKDPNRMYYVPSLPVGEEWAVWTWVSQGTELWQVQAAPMVVVPSRSANDPASEKAVRKLANKLARKEDAWARRLGNLLLQGLEGWIVVEHGERNTTLYEIAGALAKEFPYVKPLELAQIFRNCISHMQEAGSTQTVETFSDQIKRRQDDERLTYEQTKRQEIPMGDWRESLSRSSEGEIRPSAANAMRILKHDPNWTGVLAFNELTQQPVYLASPPSHDAPVGEITDPDIVETAAWLDANHGVSFPTAIVYEGIGAASSARKLNPVREYLESLNWDGTVRTPTWLADFCQAEDTEINRIFGAKWLIAAVARAFEPGCKADNCLLLKGEQDNRKTFMLETLAGEEWFCTLFKSLEDQDSRQNLRGKWIVELGELASTKKSTVEAVKQFLSERADHYRASYARTAKTVPRRCVFAGTTNETNPLVDHTGNRRFWPVEVRYVDIGRVQDFRSQLWAEAVYWYRAGKAARGAWEASGREGEEPCIWWLSDREKVAAKTIQAANRLVDSWEHNIAEILRRKEKVRTSEILLELGIVPRSTGNYDGIRAERCLRSLFWKQIVDGPDKFWIRTPVAEPRQVQTPALSVVGKPA